MEASVFSRFPREKIDRRRVELSFSFNHRVWRCRGFYQHYQINRGDTDNETDESESGGKNELTSESFHSVFGFIMMVAEKTGWTKEQILKDYSFAELSFMLADSPRMIRKKKEVTKLESDEELAAWFGTTIE